MNLKPQNQRSLGKYLCPHSRRPGGQEILNLATNAANQIFGKRMVCCQGVENLLKYAFWFNIMGKGESTGWHNHKSRAHASGVCYLEVPPTQDVSAIATPKATNTTTNPKPAPSYSSPPTSTTP